MTKKIKFLIFLFWILITSTSILFSQSDIMPIDKIKPGMKGYGKTVFRGTKIEKFEVEIISVLKNIRPRGDLILARLKGDVIDKAGIIAGMSGSPVYVNDKIAGAVAFSWAFSKEPITAITPIEDMLEIMDRKYNTNFYNFEPNMIKNYYVNNSQFNIRPIKTPLIFQGISESGIRLFQKDFEEMGFIPVAGGSAGDDIEVPEKFEPGSAVGVNLIIGDLNISAVGTVTYVKDNKLLIFGHPMFFSGIADLPLSYAYIYTVLPSLYHSFKIGSSTKIAGRIYQDQLSGLAGVLGEKARLIPFKLSANYQGVKKVYNYNIIRSYTLLPKLIGLCVFRSVETTGGWRQNNTLNFEFNIKFDNGKKLKIKDTIPGITVYDSLNSGMFLFIRPLSEILINKFNKVAIKNIEGRLDITTKIKIVEIKKILVPKKEYKPGDTVDVKIVLKEYQGKTIIKKMKFKLPPNLKDKDFLLVVSSGREAQFVDYLLSPAKYIPYNFDQLIEIINNLAQTTELALWGIIREKGVVINGERLERIPSSYFSMLKDSLETGASPVLTLLKEKLMLDYAVVGSASYRIKLKKT